MNIKYNLVPYEVIEKAITGDTNALLAVQEAVHFASLTAVFGFAVW